MFCLQPNLIKLNYGRLPQETDGGFSVTWQTQSGWMLVTASRYHVNTKDTRWRRRLAR